MLLSIIIRPRLIISLSLGEIGMETALYGMRTGRPFFTFIFCSL